MKKLTIALGIVLLIIIIAVSILSFKKSQQNAKTSAPGVTPGVAARKNPYYQPGKKSFVIYVQNWSFNPAAISVRKGDSVLLQFKSVDVTHGVSISGYNVNEKLLPFKWVNVEFVANKTGTFEISCTINCGPKGYNKMKGVLNVQ